MAVKSLKFFIATIVGAISLWFFYKLSYYPFEPIDITYYFNIISIPGLDSNTNSKIIFLLFTLILSFIYHLLYRKIASKIILKGFIVALIVFSLYIGALLLAFGISRVNYMGIYLIQDLFGLLIFYLIVSFIYRRA